MQKLWDSYFFNFVKKLIKWLTLHWCTFKYWPVHCDSHLLFLLHTIVIHRHKSLIVSSYFHNDFMHNLTRLHSSRMRTARALTVSPSMLCTGGCTWSGGWGVPGLGGVCVPVGGVGCTWSWGVYLVWGCTWSWGVYLVPGGVPGPRGCTWSQGGTWSRGVYLVLWGVPGLGGVPGPGGVYLVPGGLPGLGGYLSGGVYLARGVYLVRYSPSPVDRITDTCKNITLPQLRCGR